MRSENRRTLLTDDSALGSLRDQDLESTAHDGDIEDISDQDIRQVSAMYYPVQQDSARYSKINMKRKYAEDLF